MKTHLFKYIENSTSKFSDKNYTKMGFKVSKLYRHVFVMSEKQTNKQTKKTTKRKKKNTLMYMCEYDKLRVYYEMIEND